MDIEKLTKHQVVLLTLLVSFVTSIATGIVTVSLMDYAPPSITRTINQIVEHTVETVAPAVQGAAAVTTTKETTVVVKDEDLLSESIATAQKSIVRIVSKNTPDQLAARGVVVSEKGVVVSDRGTLEPLGTVNFEAILPSGVRVPAVMRIPTASSTVAILDLTLGTNGAAGLEAATIANISKLRLGQTVIRIGGTGSDTVSTGVIARLPDAQTGVVQASVVSTTPGSLIMTSFGEIIGIVTTGSAAYGADFYTLLPAP